MSPTCRRHVAETVKCRQICPKLHVGSDTTHEKRVPDTADLCVVLPTLYKITSKNHHIMPPRGRKTTKCNTALTAVTTAATTAATTATAAAATEATGAATATAAGGPPHRPLPYPVLQIQASSDSGPDWSRLCSVGYMATTGP